MIHSPSNRSTSKDPSWNEERVCPFLILKLSIFIYLIVLCETEHYRWVNLDSWKRYMAPEIMRRGKFHEATILASLYESDVQKQSKYLLQTSSKLSWRGGIIEIRCFCIQFCYQSPGHRLYQTVMFSRTPNFRDVEYFVGFPLGNKHPQNKVTPKKTEKIRQNLR